MTELLPCPFCGYEACLIEDEPTRGFCVVECTNCSAHGPMSDMEHAVKRWNTRAVTIEENDVEVLGDVTEGLFRDLMEADPETAKLWARSWPELVGDEDDGSDGYARFTCGILGYESGVDEGIDGEWHRYEDPYYDLTCGHRAYGTMEPSYCPECGRRVV